MRWGPWTSGMAERGWEAVLNCLPSTFGAGCALCSCLLNVCALHHPALFWPQFFDCWGCRFAVLTTGFVWDLLFFVPFWFCFVFLVVCLHVLSHAHFFKTLDLNTQAEKHVSLKFCKNASSPTSHTWYIKGSPLPTAQLVIANASMFPVELLTVAMRTLTFAFPDSFYMNDASAGRFEGEGWRIQGDK